MFKAVATKLVNLDESALEAVTGGLSIPENYPESTNVIDVRALCELRDRPIDFGNRGWNEGDGWGGAPRSGWFTVVLE